MDQDLQSWLEELDEDIEEEERDWDEQSRAHQELFTGPYSVTSLIIKRQKLSHGGSRAGRSQNIDRRREKGAEDLWRDYFSEDPIYDELKFRRRFRMSSRLFNRVLTDVCAQDDYFCQKRDAAGKLGLSPHQKVTAALRQLAYGVGADATDEYCRIAESTAIEALYRFVKAIRQLYERQYLRKPTAEDFKEALEINESRGFPGMFGSLDCMHYRWKNCPVAWQGQYTDKDKKRSMILEAIADQRLVFWHVFFGLAGGNNDLNVLDHSPLLNEWLTNDSSKVNFSINGTQYNRAYLLVDAIYPKWSMFISTIHEPQTDKLKHFAMCQEAARKDVERAFGVLQARFEIIKSPARSWYEQNVINILMACVVLHNMIIEDERDDTTPSYLRVPDVPIRRDPMPWRDFLSATADINNSVNHFRLRNDIVEHLWARKGVGLLGL